MRRHRVEQSFCASFREKGMAVIMAIFTVALIASLGSYLLWQQNLMLRAVANQREQAQLYQIEQASLEFIKTVLREDSRYNMIDHYGELWAFPLPEMDIEDWKLSGKITDAQAKFNVNNLVNYDGSPNVSRVEQYKRLLHTLELPTELADTLVDWIDKDSAHFSAAGAEDEDYLAMNPPYRAANQPMTDITNLVRVKGYTTEIIAQLEPYIIALPDKTPVNINTASPEVLSSVVFGLTLQDAQAFELSRNRVPLTSIGELNNRLPGREFDMGDNALSINTSYFIVDGYIAGNASSRRIRVLLYRERYGYPIVLWRQQL